MLISIVKLFIYTGLQNSFSNLNRRLTTLKNKEQNRLFTYFYHCKNKQHVNSKKRI